MLWVDLKPIRGLISGQPLFSLARCVVILQLDGVAHPARSHIVRRAIPVSIHRVHDLHTHVPALDITRQICTLMTNKPFVKMCDS